MGMNQKGQFSAIPVPASGSGAWPLSITNLPTVHCSQPLVLAEGGPELSVCCYFLTSPPTWELWEVEGDRRGARGRLRERVVGAVCPGGEAFSH